MGLGHTIGKLLGLSRDLEPREIRRLLEELRTQLEAMEKGVKSKEKYGPPYIAARKACDLLMSQSLKQDRIKLKLLSDLWYKKLTKYAYEDASLVPLLDFKIIPSIKNEIDRLLKEVYPA